MVYFVFDLDLTLADIDSSLYDTLYNLEDNYEEYTSFVTSCAEKETSAYPLGFLRTGLVRSPFLPSGFTPYMEQILTLKTQGICQGVIIYSNNGYLGCLTFVRDVIHTILGVNDLICHCIHRTYPSRPKNGDPAKTWKELTSILTSKDDPKNTCVIENLEPSNVLFFDDRPNHKIRNELQSNYITVYPYENLRDPSSTDKLNTMRTAVYSAMEPNNNNVSFLMDDSILIKLYTKKLLESDTNTIQSAINRFTKVSPTIQGGRHTQYTVRNRIKQKKQQRKHKYSKKQRQKKGKKSSS